MDRKILRIALIQFDRSRTVRKRIGFSALNILEKIEAVDVVCFPEVWMGPVILDETEIHELIHDFSVAAKEKRFMLLTGGLLVKKNDTVYDICHIIDKDRGFIGEQRKIFPSEAVGERCLLTGGEGLITFTCAGVRCGILICVDLFYPELSRELALAHVEVIFNPANIPEQRNELWHRLVRTRAAENTVFIAFANNTNTHYLDGRPVKGGSIIAEPSGDTIADDDKKEGIIYGRLEIEKIHRQRKRWPYVEDIKQTRRKAKDLFSIREIKQI